MTNQEKKVYLLRYRSADAEINDLLREKDRIMTRLTKCTASISGMPHGSSDADRLSDGVDKLIALDNEIDAKIDTLVAMRREIMRYISALGSDTQKRLLRLRYIDGMTWERIAVEMHYERRQINRIHGYALSALEMS